MGTIATAIASSHAFALQDPSSWDIGRNKNLEMFRAKYGSSAPIHSGDYESVAVDEKLYREIRDAHDSFSKLVVQRNASAAVIIGDDQDENFSKDILPQLAIYVGDNFKTADRWYRSNQELNLRLVSGLVEAGFEPASIGKLQDDRLLSHAHGPVLQRLLADVDIPVVLVFLNAIHQPAMEPLRCYKLGLAMRKVLSSADDTFAIIGSGGLSHFTAGYPWKHYSGKFRYGDISEDFDKEFLESLRQGKVGSFAKSTRADDLLNHGEIETRNWIVLAGIMGRRRPKTITYHPFFRALMGMGVAAW